MASRPVALNVNPNAPLERDVLFKKMRSKPENKVRAVLLQ
jgi:hypothetical protein